MPATESTWRNQPLLHRIFAVTGVLLTLTTVWMFYKDHVRSWKYIQPKALAVEQKMTLWREEQVKATDAYAAHFIFEEKLLEASTRALPKEYKPLREPDKVKNPLEDFVRFVEEDEKG